jgi:hypothetical protein
MNAIPNQQRYKFTTREEREASIPDQEEDTDRRSDADRGPIPRRLVFFRCRISREDQGLFPSKSGFSQEKSMRSEHAVSSQTEMVNTGSIPDSKFKRQVSNELQSGEDDSMPRESRFPSRQMAASGQVRS